MELTPKKAVILFCAWLVLMAIGCLNQGCGTVHKMFTSSKKTVDSVASSTRDTSHISHESASSDNFSAKDVHIRVEYPTVQPGDTTHYETGQAVRWEPYYPAKDSVKASDYSPGRKKAQTYADLIRQAIASSGGAGRIPSSITIDIGSIQDSSSRSDKKDSGSSHATSTAAVHKMEHVKNQEVTRTGMPVGVKLGVVLVIILILCYLVYRFKKTIFPL